MKILIATFTYAPNQDGVAEAAGSMAEALADLGHQVEVATTKLKERQLLQQCGIQIHQFDISGYANWRVGLDGQTEAYADFLREDRWNVIFFHCWDTWSTYLALPLLKNLRAKKILVSHGFSAHEWERTNRFPFGLVNWTANWNLGAYLIFQARSFDRIVLLSPQRDTGRFLDGWMMFLTKHPGVRIIPNSVRVRDFTFVPSGELRQKLGIEGKKLILNVANYSERKNQVMALRAFSVMSDSSAVLVFIGSEENEYLNYLKREKEKIDPNCKANVYFLSGLNREKIREAFREADIFLLSAKKETQPIVLLEAMASGLPWISTNTGCVASMEGGVVVNNLQEMTTAMTKLLRDPGLRRKISEEGFRAAEKFYDRGKVVKAYQALLEECESSAG